MSRPEAFASKHLSSGSYDSGWNADSSVPPSPSASLSSLEGSSKDGSSSSPSHLVRGTTISTVERKQKLIRRQSAPLKMRVRPFSEFADNRGLFDSFEVRECVTQLQSLKIAPFYVNPKPVTADISTEDCNPNYV